MCCVTMHTTQILKGMDKLLGVGNSVKIVFYFFEKGSTPKGKNLLPFGANGSKFFSFRVDPFWKDSVQESKQEVTKVVSLVKSCSKSTRCIKCPEDANSNRFSIKLPPELF